MYCESFPFCIVRSTPILGIQWMHVWFIHLFIQVAPTLGTGLMSDISYTVTFTGSSTTLQFTMTTCNFTNNCILRVLGTELSPSDTYTVSVVASNIIGSGTAAVFPIIPPHNNSSQQLLFSYFRLSTYMQWSLHHHHRHVTLFIQSKTLIAATVCFNCLYLVATCMDINHCSGTLYF